MQINKIDSIDELCAHLDTCSCAACSCQADGKPAGHLVDRLERAAQPLRVEYCAHTGVCVPCQPDPVDVQFGCGL